ncbi:hypothetical protein [Catellatospora methionotrophica]|uniref:hypothetical protein n=1 Tax=Catellatospora methionotrophica TaxID=121620 RepID=UPI00340D78F3
MVVTADSLLGRRSPSRAAIYRHMLANPNRDWTVRDLIVRLADVGVSAESARATVYLLVDARIVVMVPGHWRLTVRLAQGADETLRRLLNSWPALDGEALA